MMVLLASPKHPSNACRLTVHLSKNCQTWEYIENKGSESAFFVSKTWEHTENKATYLIY
jgi:hypothetical protein